jgi:hypothetical protein
MGFRDPVRQRGKEIYKLKLTNKQIVGPVSAQALVEWWLGTDKWNYKRVVRLHVLTEPKNFILYSNASAFGPSCGFCG